MHLTHAQPLLEFKKLSKVPPFIGTTVGGAFSQQSIFVRDWSDYHHYSFAATTWSTIKFKGKSTQSMKGMTWMSTVYLPSFEKVITLSDEIEILDIETLGLSYLQIEGGAPVLAGTAVWQEKIYLFGGFISVPRGKDPHRSTVFSNRLIVFDPATLTFEELDTLPGPDFRIGTFVNDKLYAFGPVPGHEPETDVIRYDPEKNQWEKIRRIPVYVGALHKMVTGSFCWAQRVNEDTWWFTIP